MITCKTSGLFVLGLSLVSSSGCSKGSEPAEPQPGASQGNEAAPETSPENPAWGATLSDGQILEILSAVDSAEIEQAQVALNKARSPGVRDFAKQMIDAHGASKQEVEQLASTGGTPRSDSAISLNLKPKAADVLQTLNSTDPANFDHAYMMSQIQQHDEVLKMLNEQVIPAASSEAVRQLMTKAKAMVEHHLAQARQVKVEGG